MAKKFIEEITVKNRELAYDIISTLEERIDGKYEIVFNDGYDYPGNMISEVRIQIFQINQINQINQ